MQLDDNISIDANVLEYEVNADFNNGHLAGSGKTGSHAYAICKSHTHGNLAYGPSTHVNSLACESFFRTFTKLSIVRAHFRNLFLYIQL